ncbi:hypothetical protein MRX96_009252 [Rhipicephalus microplus]
MHRAQRGPRPVPTRLPLRGRRHTLANVLRREALACYVVEALEPSSTLERADGIDQRHRYVLIYSNEREEALFILKPSSLDATDWIVRRFCSA